ncbi:putative ADP-ribosylation factor GTPase-activating protein AGD14 [Canna indica]|uniref:ADP-ribosylation factor GTPase-activating protein AGD14 n=1 Tax=Canna indica TaxID=4628 RepID=A0AAQ3QLK6_9LILI|nr:putative ADP-ribosylation factor GTPase-activating protein AGD14 [Canna indica]
MASRIKEDEKNEKIIRGLLKLPANRRCINCNNLGPQYVCTNFWTFICTNCSGIHREFTHRVKSISMAKFTSQEVAALQEGGNERAREIYFKEWDPPRHSFPDSSNIDRLRDFIKHVYVDRRYAGGGHGDKPQRMKGDRDDNNENLRAESYRGGSRSPPYEDRYSPSYGSRNDDRSLRYNFGQRSPGYGQGDNKRSPARFEVVDDRFREDKFANGSQNKRLEDRRLPDMPKPEGRSPDRQKNVVKLSPPVVRPVRDILGDDVPQLQVGGSPKSNGTRVSEDSAKMKSSLSSSSIGSTDGNSAQLNLSYSESLIDFSVDPEPIVAATSELPVHQKSNPVTGTGGEWAAFGVSGQQNVPQVAPSANPLESALSQLQVSGSAPSGNMSTLSSVSGQQNVPQVAPSANPLKSALSQLPVSGSAPSGNMSILSSGIDSSPKVADGWNLQTIQHQELLAFPSNDNLHTNQPSNAPAVGGSSNQNWMSSPAQNGQGSFTLPTVNPANPAGHLPKIFTKPPQQTSAGVSSQPSSAENRSSGRKELPADLFASLYPTTPVSAPGWQRVHYPSMGYNMQYPTSVVIPAFAQSPKSVNPFDITNDPASMFPSVAPPSLPNMAPPATLLRSSSFGAPNSNWVPPQQLPYAHNAPSSPFAVPQLPNMSQQIANATLSMRNQTISTSGAASGTSGTDQNPAIRYNQPSTPNSFSATGGNPFG